MTISSVEQEILRALEILTLDGVSAACGSASVSHVFDGRRSIRFRFPDVVPRWLLHAWAGHRRGIRHLLKLTYMSERRLSDREFKAVLPWSDMRLRRSNDEVVHIKISKPFTGWTHAEAVLGTPNLSKPTELRHTRMESEMWADRFDDGAKAVGGCVGFGITAMGLKALRAAKRSGARRRKAKRSGPRSKPYGEKLRRFIELWAQETSPAEILREMRYAPTSKGMITRFKQQAEERDPQAWRDVNDALDRKRAARASDMQDGASSAYSRSRRTARARFHE